MKNEDVILCKGLSEKNQSHEKYIKTLTNGGYNCCILQSLTFKFVNCQSFKRLLESPSSYSGLILTSPRSIEAINYVTNGEVDDLWRELTAYCVGISTEILAKDCLKLRNCDGSDSGNSKNLAEYIVSKCKVDDKPLLYPCSSIVRDTIEQHLLENNIKLHKEIVYETLPSETLRSDLTKVISTNTTKIFVFFSPSIVEYIFNIINQDGISLDNIKSVAIGPVTAEAVRKTRLKLCAIAAKPDPICLLQAIQQLDN